MITSRLTIEARPTTHTHKEDANEQDHRNRLHAFARNRVGPPAGGGRRQMVAAAGEARELPTQPDARADRHEDVPRNETPARDHDAACVLLQPERASRVQAVRAVSTTFAVVAQADYPAAQSARVIA